MCLWVPCRAVPSTTGLSPGVKERCTLPSGLARTGTPPARATWSRLSPCIACRIHKQQRRANAAAWCGAGVDLACEVKHKKYIALRQTLTLNAGSLSLSLSLFPSPSPNQTLFLTANIIGLDNPIDRPQHAVWTPRHNLRRYIHAPITMPVHWIPTILRTHINAGLSA